MCGFRPSASTLATWLSSYYFSASYREEEGPQKSSILTPRVVPTALTFYSIFHDSLFYDI